jgi:hypothetical protein
MPRILHQAKPVLKISETVIFERAMLASDQRNKKQAGNDD